ncbi:MAG: hypothetical protein HKN86_02505 [Acidimicrobiia bacterium]|nr:hypothetical protein [Acidimicrobiia bacterium]
MKNPASPVVIPIPSKGLIIHLYHKHVYRIIIFYKTVEDMLHIQEFESKKELRKYLEKYISNEQITAAGLFKS